MKKLFLIIIFIMGVIFWDDIEKHGSDFLFLKSASAGSILMVKKALETGVNVNKIDTRGQTALIRASHGGYYEVVKILLSQPKTDVNRFDHEGRTALLWAVKRRKLEVVEMLLTHPKIDVNKVDRYTHTALKWAIRNGDIAVAKILRENGAKDTY